ncbi:MAG: hypothetical protein GY929_20310, partial [Actinomycetia bacterium]|nr:hypothetical protein [Actinomycetes bacterium]
VAQTELIDIANQLWAWVQAGELPPATGPDALPYVKEAHKVADPDATANIDDLADLIERHELLKAAAKTAVAEAKTAEAQIRERMGTATEALTTDGQWRVRCGTPIFKFTDWSERDFIELHCIHGDDCAPDCTTHRPDLLQPTLCRDEAKAEMPDEYDAARYPTTDRRLTTKRMETQ